VGLRRGGEGRPCGSAREGEQASEERTTHAQEEAAVAARRGREGPCCGLA